MSDFMIIRPIDVTDARLTSCNIAEPAVGVAADPPAWSAATNYAVGARVHRATTHRIYERVGAGGTDATLPEDDAALAIPTKWVEVSSTNRWRMFDNSYNTQSSANGSITFKLSMGNVIADSMMFDNVDADEIRVQVEGTAFDQTISLKSRNVNDWWKYFFEPFSYKTAAIFTGMPLLINNVINVTISKGSGVVKCGTCVVGLSKVIGVTQSDASVGIKDFSVKETNPFGTTTVAERVYSKRMDVLLTVPNDTVDDVYQLLSSYRAKPIVWVGAGNKYSCMMMYGFFQDFGIVIPNYPLSKCTLRIEGLT